MANSAQEKRQHLVSINENNLARVIHWVSVIDSKAKFVLTLVLAVIGFALAQLERSTTLFLKLWTLREFSLAIILGGILLIALFFLTRSTVYLLIVIYPKRIPYTQKDSVFFYDLISKMAFSDFSTKMESIELADVIKGLSDQTYNLSKVVTAKFDQLSISIKSFSIGLVVFVLYMVLETVLTNIFF